jgi:hypothetical protein
LEVTPFVGTYLPGGALVIDTVFELTGTDTYYISGAAVRHQRALGAGAQLSAWFGSHVALEIAGAYAPSGTVTRTYACDCQATGGCPSNCVTSDPEAAYVVTGSARLLVPFAPPRVGRPSLYVVAGCSVVNHGGMGFDAAERIAGHALQSTYWGPIVGVGARLQLTPARAERVELVRIQQGTQPQADLVLSVGLSYTLRGPTVSSASTEQPE